ncbi:potassium transporter Kup [Myxococcus llanfairpwllgwyngyllgogerychwyrndrobwllllantysiliogogogochensis]|uniref:Probable potassium transport system protein Kup n=1 Tax=Myxococcus llanfairpwllgwyngyllgogerychwyrndrobwllllantysiliogogogochensis TaxID=2590453 RepID=A0A540WZ35_9BACT|nr:potassium transporter Kup [Myxococcus llanfairpwllgwyngyllgogerychwyrndrobwllllantysiliogogogochensis]TQF14272.1 potassium transporter Kup [Myxococcus llanfairpwllgwyngyllgogerychwyrndrobwllllantysiliogogogochensis]
MKATTTGVPGGEAVREGPDTFKRTALLALGALGIVYGDIGTSPLYALRECFTGPHGIHPTPENVLGVLSLIFWSLLIIVSVKYLIFVMRADNRGEGGILALMALVMQRQKGQQAHTARPVLITLGIFGAALLYGDGLITPAITVLSAVEGLSVATPVFEPFIVPITLAILVVLFLVQRHGTAGIGAVFGPVMCVWFFTLAALGVKELVHNPAVLGALSPTHGFMLFVHNGWHGFLVLGGVFLVVTGCEALYADMGHFGWKPIKRAWFFVVLPALMLNYLGQGALLLRDASAARNPFFLLAPSWLLYPLVALSAVAGVIASQALISGAFSLTRQAMQLGYSPRMEVVHTSAEEMGQIYLPGINWALMAGVFTLVLTFRSSSALASAYGIAVSTTMVITSFMAYVVARERWGVSRKLAIPVAGVFLTVELAFFSANAMKLADGGWFPLLLAVMVFTLMTTWKRGRDILAAKLRASSIPLKELLGSFGDHPPVRVPGTAIFMTGNADGTPPALLHNLKHNKVLHEQVVLLTIQSEDVPHIPAAERVEVEPLEQGFVRVVATYGFMENPSIPDVLKRCREKGLQFQLMGTSFFLGRETLIPTKRPGMAVWREALFAWMSRNARSATAYFRIPPNRVVELGSQVEL